MNIDKLKEKNIAVFMGGISEEREISLKSGKAVYQALKNLGFKVIEVDITSSSEEEIKERIEYLKIDLVFIALHGTFGEDGSLQKILERVGIVYTGSDSKASRLAMDKIAAKQMFIKAGLNVPPFFVVDAVNIDEAIVTAQNFGFPLVVKPSNSGSSIGLSLIQDRSAFKQALSLARKFSSSIIVEKFIKAREITVGILDNAALPPIEIVPDEPFFNFRAKYESEGTQYIVPAKLDRVLLERFKEAGLRAHSCLSCRGFSRVDMLLERADNKIYVLEVNTIPGLTQRSLLPKAAQCAGFDFSQLCLKIIASATRSNL